MRSHPFEEYNIYKRIDIRTKRLLDLNMHWAPSNGGGVYHILTEPTRWPPYMYISRRYVKHVKI